MFLVIKTGKKTNHYYFNRLSELPKRCCLDKNLCLFGFDFNLILKFEAYYNYIQQYTYILAKIKQKETINVFGLH